MRRLTSPRPHLLQAVVCLAFVSCLYAEGPGPDATLSRDVNSPLTASQVVGNLVRRNAERKGELARLQGQRTYHLTYRGFPGDREAQMRVQCLYQSPSSKQFLILDSSGPKVILDKVFKKLLEGEQEASQSENEQRSALNPDNYDFALVGYEQGPDGPAYILDVQPKSKNRFLYQGRIWVDGNDFAVKKIKAEPARNPSLWTRKNEIEHEYMKVGHFWLPAHNRSVSLIRLGGTATLTIEYSDYEIVSAHGQRASSEPSSTESGKKHGGEQ
ncbi:MAG TPA: hypothetical protein VK473_14670 [Terriglobales bacterium]|nr:hypothetical protein [Terriglobales bacterium]